MDIVRDTYKPERYGGISLHNEPPDDLKLTANVRLYPDMYYVYKVFSDWLNVPQQNLILGNGAENAIKNVLLAVKPKSISWSTPTWGFIDVYCAQTDSIPFKHQFKHPKNEKNTVYVNYKFEEELFNEDVDVYYNTLEWNSIIGNDIENANVEKARFSIIDLTYCDLAKIRSTVDEFKKDLIKNGNLCLVGSFDKLFGAGLRLGFAVFSDKYSSAMQIQRENYINALAADFILKHEFTMPEKKYYMKLKKLLKNCMLPYKTMLSMSYITVPTKAEFTQLQHREIKIDGTWYSKFGIPHDEEEWYELQMTLGLTKFNG